MKHLSVYPDHFRLREFFKIISRKRLVSSGAVIVSFFHSSASLPYKNCIFEIIYFSADSLLVQRFRIRSDFPYMLANIP